MDADSFSSLLRTTIPKRPFALVALMKNRLRLYALFLANHTWRTGQCRLTDTVAGTRSDGARDAETFKGVIRLYFECIRKLTEFYASTS
ncbi:unnamed protein product [Nippostrongylus brasiliensis]|uniref:Transposase n=1 Tax=Nippostrongylus brasiliensis TaxID=27835 RepID=A0A0N4XJC5_NIPBR|nr:unnamed protein product [Nippostrongylus brasiliensis]